MDSNATTHIMGRDKTIIPSPQNTTLDNKQPPEYTYDLNLNQQSQTEQASVKSPSPENEIHVMTPLPPLSEQAYDPPPLPIPVHITNIADADHHATARPPTPPIHSQEETSTQHNTDGMGNVDANTTSELPPVNILRPTKSNVMSSLSAHLW